VDVDEDKEGSRGLKIAGGCCGSGGVVVRNLKRGYSVSASAVDGPYSVMRGETKRSSREDPVNLK
jgi:hypothetical protein